MPFLTNVPLPQCLQHSSATRRLLARDHDRGCMRYLLEVKCLPARVVTTSGNLDTGGEVDSSGSERDEARGAGGGARERPEPGGEPLEVDRGRGRDVLQVRLGQAAVAAT